MRAPESAGVSRGGRLYPSGDATELRRSHLRTLHVKAVRVREANYQISLSVLTFPLLAALHHKRGHH